MSHNQNCVLGPKIKTRFSWTLTVFFYYNYYYIPKAKSHRCLEYKIRLNYSLLKVCTKSGICH